MSYKTMPTESVSSKYGDVTARVAKILVIEVHAGDIYMEDDVTEIHLMVNGRKFTSMHPIRAERLGLVTRK